MELDPLQNQTVTTAVTQANSQIDAATLPEIICIIAVPILAILIGMLVNRYIHSKKHTSWGLKAIDFTAPLLSPLLTVLFTLLSIAIFRATDIAIYILPFLLKLAVSWVAIRTVTLMSTKRTAGWFIALVIIPITLLHLFDWWDGVTGALQEVKFSVGNAELNLFLIFKGIAAIVILQSLASFSISLTERRLRKIRDLRASNRALILKIFQIALYCFLFIVAMQVLGINLTALSVFGGALGVGLGFGLQKIASNFISGIILLFEKSIEVDDLIELADGTTGVVRKTNARYTLLEMLDGKEVLIPNEEFISQRVISWTHSHTKARAEIIVTISYDSNMAKAKELMLECARAHPKCLKNPAPNCFATAFGENGVEMRLYFWILDAVDGRIEPKSDVIFAIMSTFSTNNITIPYPKREVFYTNAATPMVGE